MYRTSQPYAPGGSVYWTTYTYDGLGRTITVTAADSSSNTTYAYNGSTTVVTDPAGNWKAMTTDVDGNLKSVIEPDPAYGSPAAPGSAQNIDCASYPAPSQTLGTCYAYDVLKNLTTVRMPRSNGTQTRTFTYQAGTNWLLTATNPENGTVTYTRDKAGHVLSRVDAIGQTTSYTYDGYNRLTQVKRAPAWHASRSLSDGELLLRRPDGRRVRHRRVLWQADGGDLWHMGRPGSGSVCPGTAVDSSTWVGLTYEYQYSSAGQTTGKRMIVSRNGYYGLDQINLDAYWTYDNEGRVLTTQYPVVTDPNSGDPTSTAYTYNYDTMGRASTMTNGLNSSV